MGGVKYPPYSGDAKDTLRLERIVHIDSPALRMRYEGELEAAREHYENKSREVESRLEIAEVDRTLLTNKLKHLEEQLKTRENSMAIPMEMKALAHKVEAAEKRNQELIADLDQMRLLVADTERMLAKLREEPETPVAAAEIPPQYHHAIASPEPQVIYVDRLDWRMTVAYSSVAAAVGGVLGALIF